MRVRKVRNEIAPRLREIERDLEPLVRNATKEFKKVTPKRTGNAKRQTTQKGNSIDANYPYANRLNEGYSRQAPNGMTDPTIDYIRGFVRKILR